MKITVEKDSFLPLLGQVQGILEKKANIPILSNILIEAGKKGVFVYASDSEISFSGALSGEAEGEGKTVVSGKKLFEIVREFSPGKISLIGGEKSAVTIKKDQSKYVINSLPPEDFPVFPPAGGGGWREIEAEEFLDVVDKTIYCASLDESRYHLTGVFCERVSSGVWRFVATDGHRMSFIDTPLQGGEGLEDGLIIPRKGILEIKKMLSAGEGGKLSLSVEKPRLAARFKGQTLSVRLIEAKYPDYRRLIPEKQEERKKAVFNRGEIVSALRRISVMTSARYRGVNFEFEKGSLKLSTSHSELGEALERIDCQYEAESLKIRFNSRYVLEALQSFSGESVEALLKDRESSLLIQEEKKDNCKAVIMPMRF